MLCRSVIISAAVLLCVKCRRGSTNDWMSVVSENDVLEKSEVVLKFPTYAIKIPPIITSRGRSNTKVDPVPVSCSSKNVTKSLSDLRKRIKCIPRDTVVDLTAPDGSSVDPKTVVVKRCGGMCRGTKKCLSAKRVYTEFYVRTIHEKSTMVFCNSIKVFEDVECKCGCLSKKKDCNEKQRFNENLCKCICTNKEEQMDCLNKADLNFKWNSRTCTCGCRAEKICTTGSVWMQSKCKCVKV